MKRSLLLVLVIMAFSYSFSQIGDEIEKNQRQRNNDNPFGKNRRDAIYSHSNSHYRPFGWFINPGVTYMIGNSADDNGESYKLTPSGLPGYYLEGGLAFLMKKANKAVHYFDVGLGVKHFGGMEKFDDGTYKERGDFNFGSIFLRGAVHNCWQLNMYNFIDQSIGVNFDYRIYGGKGDDTYDHGGVDPNNHKMALQLNYSFGWGIKIRDGFFIIPTIQTPIVSFLPWDGFNPGLQWFSSKYQPTILTIKFGWLFPKKGCNVPSDPRQKEANDRYQMQ